MYSSWRSQALLLALVKKEKKRETQENNKALKKYFCSSVMLPVPDKANLTDTRAPSAT
jgi:hypothetical protein